MVKRKYAIVLLALLSMAARAQYDMVPSHYWAMEPMYNPAAVGKEAKINAVGAYNMTLVGFDNNPRTMHFAADMPLMLFKQRHGIGAQFTNDELGLFSHKRFSLQYAFRHKLFGGLLGVGFNLSMLAESFDGSKVDLETPDDPAIPTSEVNGSAFDFGAGLYYQRGPWYAGVSAQHLAAPEINIGERQSMKVDMSYYFTAGYNIKLRNPFLSLQPSVLGRGCAGVYRADITLRGTYRHESRLLYAGLGYSPTNSLTAFVGGNFHGVMLGYSYEYFTSAVSFGNGAHELFLGYQTDVNLGKKGRNKHKSVRFL